MRVNELSRELGRTNKEVLDLLRAQGYEVKSHSSNVSGEQIDAVRRGFAGKPARAEKEPTPVKGMGESEGRAPSREEQDSSRVKSQENRENWEQVQKERIGKAEAARVEEIKREPVKTEADGNGTAEPPKKRITAVYRPQNSTMKSSKPSGGQRQGQGRSQGGNGQGRQGNQNGQGNQGSREAGQGNRDGGRSFNRDGQGGRDGGRGFNRDGQRGRGGDRGGLSIPKPSFDGPVVQKQQNTKQSKNNYKNDYKNDKYSRPDREEELRTKPGRGGKPGKGAFIMPQKKEEPKREEVKTIILPEVITIKELAEKMKMQPSVIVKKLFLQGTVVTINQEVDYDKAEEIAMEFDILCEKEEKVDVIEELLREDEEDEKDMVERPPVVCVMGHVDHGKTSLLDAIRQTNVTAKEAGGITQHIGAYVVEKNGQKITFLDTPGHEAFTAMRMRGAKSTDIAILVVAADDGVMPQTIEAINHAKAAGVSVIVAINKMDKMGANPERVKEQLTEYELVPEEWGGDTPCIPVSAHTKEGIGDLLEMVTLIADMKELKANPDRAGKGTVIEARLDKGRGPIATVLVQNGTLHVGDIIVAGTSVGRVRAMMNDRGERVQEAGPSVPVEITGLDDVPTGGDTFNCVSDERLARELVDQRKAAQKEEQFNAQTKVTLDNLFDQMQLGDIKELKIIVKADVQGSVEAVRQSLEKLSNDEVRVRVIHGGVGAVNESDVMLANASNAIIVGFNVRPDPVAAENAERDKVDMRLYRVIYDCIEEIESAMKGMLAPKFRENLLGRAECRQVYKISNVGTIAGSYVLSGKITRNAEIRIVRDGIVIGEDKLASLRRFKDDVKEVASGYECGIGLERFNDIKEGDVFEAFVMEEYRED